MEPNSSLHRASKNSTQQTALRKKFKKLENQLDKAKKSNGPIASIGPLECQNELKETLRKCRSCNSIINKSFVEAVVAVLDDNEYSRDGERGIYLLASSLFDESISEEIGTRVLANAKKSAIGKDCLIPLIDYLADTSKESGMRRWVGILCLHLHRDCPENHKRLELGPEGYRRCLGQMIIDDPDELLKIICGQFVRNLNQQQIRLKDLFPSNYDQTIYDEFPPATQDNKGWFQLFQTFVDKIYSKKKESQTDHVGDIYFVRSISLIPEYQFDIEEHNLYMYTNTKSMVILAPLRGVEFDRVLEIPFNVCTKMRLDESSSDGGEPFAMITLEMKRTKKQFIYLNGKAIELEQSTLELNRKDVGFYRDQVLAGSHDIQIRDKNDPWEDSNPCDLARRGAHTSICEIFIHEGQALAHETEPGLLQRALEKSDKDQSCLSDSEHRSHRDIALHNLNEMEDSGASQKQAANPTPNVRPVAQRKLVKPKAKQPLMISRRSNVKNQYFSNESSIKLSPLNLQLQNHDLPDIGIVSSPTEFSGSISRKEEPTFGAKTNRSRLDETTTAAAAEPIHDILNTATEDLYALPAAGDDEQVVTSVRNKKSLQANIGTLARAAKTAKKKQNKRKPAGRPLVQEFAEIKSSLHMVATKARDRMPGMEISDEGSEIKESRPIPCVKVSSKETTFQGLKNLNGHQITPNSASQAAKVEGILNNSGLTDMNDTNDLHEASFQGKRSHLCGSEPDCLDEESDIYQASPRVPKRTATEALTAKLTPKPKNLTPETSGLRDPLPYRSTPNMGLNSSVLNKAPKRNQARKSVENFASGLSELVNDLDTNLIDASSPFQCCRKRLAQGKSSSNEEVIAREKLPTRPKSQKHTSESPSLAKERDKNCIPEPSRKPSATKNKNHSWLEERTPLGMSSKESLKAGVEFTMIPLLIENSRSRAAGEVKRGHDISTATEGPKSAIIGKKRKAADEISTEPTKKCHFTATPQVEGRMNSFLATPMQQVHRSVSKSELKLNSLKESSSQLRSANINNFTNEQYHRKCHSLTVSSRFENAKNASLALNTTMSDEALPHERVHKPQLIISFPFRGLRSQEQLNTSKIATGRHEKQTPTSDEAAERKRKREMHLPRTQSPARKRQNSSPRPRKYAETENLDSYNSPTEDLEDVADGYAVHSSPPINNAAAPAAASVQLSTIQLLQQRAELSQDSQNSRCAKVTFEGSPVGGKASRKDHVGKLKDRLGDYGKRIDFVVESDSEFEVQKSTDSDMIKGRDRTISDAFGPKVTLLNRIKAGPSSPETVVTRYVAHEKNDNDHYTGLVSKEVISREKVLQDPFVGQARGTSSFTAILQKAVAKSVETEEPKYSKPSKQGCDTFPLEKLPFLRPDRRRDVSRDPPTLLPSQPVQEKVNATELWNVAIRPHYQDAHEAVHRIADALIIRLSDEEKAMDLLVNQYRRNGSTMLNRLCKSHEEQRTAVLKSVNAKKVEMVDLYTKARNTISGIAQDLQGNPISGVENEWKKAQEEMQKLIVQGRKLSEKSIMGS